MWSMLAKLQMQIYLWYTNKKNFYIHSIALIWHTASQTFWDQRAMSDMDNCIAHKSEAMEFILVSSQTIDAHKRFFSRSDLMNYIWNELATRSNYGTLLYYHFDSIDAKIWNHFAFVHKEFGDSAKLTLNILFMCENDMNCVVEKMIVCICCRRGCLLIIR